MTTPNSDAISTELIREGRCHLCGIETHEFVAGPDGVQREKRALTIRGEVHRGRCLFCFPLPIEGQRAAATIVTPTAVVAADTPGTARSALRAIVAEGNPGAAALPPRAAADPGHSAVAQETAASRELFWDSDSTDDEAGGNGVSGAVVTSSSSATRSGMNTALTRTAQPHDLRRDEGSGSRVTYEDAVTPPGFFGGGADADSGTEGEGQSQQATPRNVSAHTSARVKRSGSEISATRKKKKKKKARHQVSSVDPIVRDIQKTVKEAAASKTAPAKLDKKIERLRKIVEAEPKYASAIFDSGGVKVIVDAMTEHCQKTRTSMLLGECCTALACLTYGSEDERIASAGAVPALVRTMKARKNSGKVQLPAIETLLNLSTKPSLREDIASTGALEAVVFAMLDKPRNKNIQQKGCMFLRNLTTASSEVDVGKMASGIAKAGGLDAVVAAMRSHPKDPNVQSNACDALTNIAYGDETLCTTAAAKGGIDALLAAATNCLSNGEILGAVCDALQTIIDDQDDTQAAASRAGAAVKVTAVVRKHAEDSSLLVKAFRVLETLARNSECASGVAQAGAADVVRRIVTNNNQDEEVQESGRALLLCLSASQREVSSHQGTFV